MNGFVFLYCRQTVGKMSILSRYMYVAIVILFNNYSSTAVFTSNSRYQIWCMDRYMERLTTKAQNRMKQRKCVIRYITSDPIKKSWSEQSINCAANELQKQRQHSQLLALSKQEESKALLEATTCLDRVLSLAQPISLPPIKRTNANNGEICWILHSDVR